MVSISQEITKYYIFPLDSVINDPFLSDNEKQKCRLFEYHK